MFLDIHAHLYKYPYPISYNPVTDSYSFIFPDREQLVKMHDDLDIDRAVLLPLVSSEVYVPQSVGEIIEICRESNGRFIPFCNIDPRVLTNTSDAPLGYLLEYYRKLGCKGMGEVLPNMEFLDPKLQNLFYHCEQTGFPVLFDLSAAKGESYGIYDDAGLPQLEQCLERFPNLIFIGHGPAFWAELGTLEKEEDRRGYPKYPVYDEGRVPKLMRSHKNLWVDLSAGSGANAMRRDLEYSIGFINEFSDRIMFGTDICFYSDNYEYVLTSYLKKLLAEKHISGEVFKAVACRNAERLLNL